MKISDCDAKFTEKRSESGEAIEKKIPLKMIIIGVAATALFSALCIKGVTALRYGLSVDSANAVVAFADGKDNVVSHNDINVNEIVDAFKSTIIDVDTTSHLAEKHDAIDFQKLQEVNKDVVGWIYCTGTSLDYPILKSHDNREYMKLNFEKKRDVAGAVFMDMANTEDFSDYNTIIYGHNMRNGSMFKTVVLYKDKAYFEKHPCMTIVTPAGAKEYNIISAYRTDKNDIIYNYSISDPTEYAMFLTKIKEKSAYNTGITADTAKKMITLSTCVGRTGGKERFVVVLQEK